MRVVLILLLLVSTARADAWYRGRDGTNRVLHLSIAFGGSLAYIATEPLESRWAPDSCRWCNQPSLDTTVARLHWSNTGAADISSHITTYVLTPAISTGMVFLNTEPTTAAVLDDVVPIAESITLARWASRLIKLGVGRKRPDESDNLSFPSGHTTTAFSAAVSAGMVAHMRGYSNERYVWIVGLTLATTSGYLRIAANRHFLTDVVGGAVLGTAFGLTVPLLMRRNVDVTASRDVLAIGGVW